MLFSLVGYINGLRFSSCSTVCKLYIYISCYIYCALERLDYMQTVCVYVTIHARK